MLLGHRTPGQLAYLGLELLRVEDTVFL